MSRSAARSVFTVLAISSGAAIGLLGLSLVYVGATTDGSHPLDDVVSIGGRILVFVGIGGAVVLWRFRRSGPPDTGTAE